MKFKSLLMTAKSAALETPRIFFAPLIGNTNRPRESGEESHRHPYEPVRVYTKRMHSRRINRALLAEELTNQQKMKFIQGLLSLEESGGQYIVKYKMPSGKIKTITYGINKRKVY